MHALRGVYAAYVYQLYQCPMTLNACLMRCLGHEKLEVSLSYNAVQLEGVQPVHVNCMGQLP